MKSYGLNILGMSEVRWSEFGEMTTQDGAIFLYSGRPEGENVSHEGVVSYTCMTDIGSLCISEPAGNRRILVSVPYLNHEAADF
jgi:hypothetical protein